MMMMMFFSSFAFFFVPSTRNSDADNTIGVVSVSDQHIPKE
jgi:hypothetical protein